MVIALIWTPVTIPNANLFIIQRRISKVKLLNKNYFIKKEFKELNG
jgi:hypothetical protein